MPTAPMPGDRVLHETTSLCSRCKNAVEALVVAVPEGEVWMRKSCEEHGRQDVRLSDDASWYESTRTLMPATAAPARTMREVEHGCPFDCGPCTSHQQKVRLPVVTITSACNLDCPICYVHNKNEGPYHMGIEEFRAILGHLTRDHGGELDIVNFTGGEPTVHPHLLDFLEMARDAGIHRVTVCSNGIRLARDEELVKRLAELGARVALSFDSFEKLADHQLQGAHLLATKTRCLDLLEKHGVDTTLIPVMTRGINDHEVGRILALGLRRSNIRHLEIHTITYTGQGGASFSREGRMSMHEVLREIERTTDGLLTPQDFVPSPCAHPLCYQIAYLLLDPAGGPPIPFTRFMPRSALSEALADRLYLEPSPRLERAMHDAIDRLWAEEDPAAERTLQLLKKLLADVFPSARPISRAESMRASERAVKAVYVHSHMDEETFDTERAAMCCASNCYADGTTVPVCNYNVLYREKESRFRKVPREWNERRGGRRSFLPVLNAGSGGK
ncbi:MAG: radical SAM protein [Candidatus Wallbacteria bacterium]|nr:radical SAM protein [Candidatus Wallbacteria bacterium]